MYATCIKEYKNKKIQVGTRYRIINADMMEYVIMIENEEILISKDDIEHFKYEV